MGSFPPRYRRAKSAHAAARSSAVSPGPGTSRRISASNRPRRASPAAQRSSHSRSASGSAPTRSSPTSRPTLTRSLTSRSHPSTSAAFLALSPLPLPSSPRPALSRSSTPFAARFSRSSSNLFMFNI